MNKDAQTIRNTGFQPEIVRGYQKAVFALLSGNCVTDLFCNNALNYEVLQGDKSGISSIRINRKYRLEFTVKDVMNEQIISLQIVGYK